MTEPLLHLRLDASPAYILASLLPVLARFLLAKAFFHMETDKLLFVSVLYPAVWDIIQFMVRLLFGSFDGISFSMFLSQSLGFCGETFFLLNRLFISINLLLSELAGTLLVFGYVRFVCKMLRDKTRAFSRAELCFLLLPSVAGWFERRGMYFLMFQGSPSPENTIGEQYPDARGVSILVMALLLAMITVNIFVYRQLLDALNEQASRKILEMQNADMRRHLEETAKAGETFQKPPA